MKNDYFRKDLKKKKTPLNGWIEITKCKITPLNGII